MEDITNENQEYSAIESEQQPNENPYNKEIQQKSFFITINNSLEKAYTTERIKEIIDTKFRKNHVIFWAKVDEQAGTFHTHIYILLGKKKRWSAVRKAFEGAHLEYSVKGSPQQCLDYLKKQGKYKDTDKAETQVEGSFYSEGSIPKYVITENKIDMLDQIQSMLDSGMNPEEIMREHIAFRQYETIIRKQFFQKRFDETPPLRDITVYWHLGESGSGKSYTFTELCKQYGDSNVFFASDYSNSCTALLDGYQAEQVLFLDEVKENSFKYGIILQLLNGYRAPIHARYLNVFSLYTEAHITSIFTPHELYETMVDSKSRTIDSEQQLLRRINFYVYHWKDDTGYHSLQIPAAEYTSYNDLKNRALNNDGFETVSEEDIPFD